MVKQADIRSYAKKVAARFQPRRIILFGSYAYGNPSPDSDVDILVVMPHEDHPAKTAAHIRTAIPPPFPLDLLVRSPAAMRKRLALQDGFIREIVSRGKSLYENDRTRMDR